MTIDTYLQTIIITTDLDACFTIDIVSNSGESVYSGTVWSKNHNISITGLEKGEYDISIALSTLKYKQHIILN